MSPPPFLSMDPMITIPSSPSSVIGRRGWPDRIWWPLIPQAEGVLYSGEARAERGEGDATALPET
jgi:hypothetical protein